MKEKKKITLQRNEKHLSSEKASDVCHGTQNILEHSALKQNASKKRAGGREKELVAEMFAGNKILQNTVL